MRFIYIYDPVQARIVEARDVSSMSDEDCEMIKVEMLLHCKCPCEVKDSLEEAEGSHLSGDLFIPGVRSTKEHH